MKTIRLYGRLAKKFGKVFRMDVQSASGAVHALCCVLPGFREYVHKSKDKYTIYIGSDDKNYTELSDPVSDREIIRIVPLVQGTGALGKIVAGAALIYLTFTTGGAALIASMGVSTAAVAGFGMSLIIGGVMELLFAPPKPTIDSYEPTDNKPSYSFNGPVNTTKQGNPVPVGYGKLRVGSQVISAGLEAVSI